MAVTEPARGEAGGLDEILEQGRRLLAQGCDDEALLCFARARDRDPASALARSCYGLALARAERRFEQAVELARSALKQEFFNPELYLNLAHIHLAFGFKAEALRCLRRGRMIDPANREIEHLLDELGRRRSQVLPFLPRGHRLNRWLGRLRTWLARPLSAEIA